MLIAFKANSKWRIHRIARQAMAVVWAALLLVWTAATAYQMAARPQLTNEREIISRLMIDGANDGTIVWPILSPTTYFNTTPISRAKKGTSDANGSFPKRIVVFGDSMSDSGNFFRRSLSLYPPNYCYFSGRFSNGPIWVDRLAELVDDLQIENYAFGGAVSSENLLPTNIPLAKDIIPSVTDQVNQLYLNNILNSDTNTNTNIDKNRNNTLYVIWAGGNDYFELIKRDDVLERLAEHPRAVVDTLFDAVDSLYTQAGARHFLMMNLPPMDSMPRFLSADMKDTAKELRQLVMAHNQHLINNIEQASERWPDAQFQLFDTHAFMTRIRAAPKKYGFSDVSTACMKPRVWGFLGGRVCRDPHQHFFWDDVHPGWRAHILFAEATYKLFRNDPTYSSP